MTSKVYIEVILPQLVDKLKGQGLMLCQDAGSAHVSNYIVKWAKDHNLLLFSLPRVLLDFSILETIAHPIKRKFHAQRCATEKASLARFIKISDEEVDQKTIKRLYMKYTKGFMIIGGMEG
jgi:hypothetical protein